MPDSDFPTKAELRVLRVLQDAPRGLYGLQIVENSAPRARDRISRGSVYVLLMRLDDKGFVDVDRNRDANHPGMPRPYYKLNALGQRVLAMADKIDLALAGAR